VNGVVISQTLEIIRKLDRQLKIPVDKRCPTLPTLIAALFYDLSTDKEIKIPSIGEKRERELRSGVIVIAIDYS
jgi:type II secretory pathway predicted ATPase ExeA